MENRRHSPTLFPPLAVNNFPATLFDSADNPDIVDFLTDCDGVAYSPGTDSAVANPENFLSYKLINTITQTVAAGKSLDDNLSAPDSYQTTITPCTARDTYQEWTNITGAFKPSIANTRWLNAFTPMVYQNLSTATGAKLCFLSSSQDALDDCFEHNGYPGATFDRTYYAYLQELLQIEGKLDADPNAKGVFKKIKARIDSAYHRLGLPYHERTEIFDADQEVPRPKSKKNAAPEAITINRLLNKLTSLATEALSETSKLEQILNLLPGDESYNTFRSKIYAQQTKLHNILLFTSFPLPGGRQKARGKITLADYQAREMTKDDLKSLQPFQGYSTDQSLLSRNKQSKAQKVIETANDKLISCAAKMDKIIKASKSLVATYKTHLKAKSFLPTINDKKAQVLDCLSEKSRSFPGKKMTEIFLDDADCHCDAVSKIKPEEIPIGITLYVYRYFPKEPDLRDFIQIGQKIIGTKPLAAQITSQTTQQPQEGIVYLTLQSHLFNNRLSQTAGKENAFFKNLNERIVAAFIRNPVEPAGNPNQLTSTQYNETFYQQLIEAAIAHPAEALAETALLNDMTDIARELNFTPLYYPLAVEVARQKNYEFELAAQETNGAAATMNL